LSLASGAHKPYGQRLIQTALPEWIGETVGLLTFAFNIGIFAGIGICVFYDTLIGIVVIGFCSILSFLAAMDMVLSDYIREQKIASDTLNHKIEQLEKTVKSLSLNE
jgi:hypothetical protein